jgi:hypothetical protein
MGERVEGEAAQAFGGWISQPHGYIGVGVLVHGSGHQERPRGREEVRKTKIQHPRA